MNWRDTVDSGFRHAIKLKWGDGYVYRIDQIPKAKNADKWASNTYQVVVIHVEDSSVVHVSEPLKGFRKDRLDITELVNFTKGLFTT